MLYSNNTQKRNRLPSASKEAHWCFASVLGVGLRQPLILCIKKGTSHAPHHCMPWAMVRCALPFWPTFATSCQLSPISIISTTEWMSKVCYRRDIWSLFQQIAWWHRPAEWVCSPEVGQWGVLLALPAESNCFSYFLLTGMEEKKNLQVNSWTPGTRGCVNLFKHNHYTSCNESHHLINLTRINIHSDPSIFCKGEIGESKEVWWESPPLHLSSSHGGHWSLQPLQECDIAFFWFSIFLGRAHSQGCHLAFCTIMSVTWKVKEQRWRCCQLLSISIPIRHPETEKNNHRMGCRAPWAPWG